MIFLGLTFQNHNTQYIGFILLLNTEWECIILLNYMIQDVDSHCIASSHFG